MLKSFCIKTNNQSIINYLLSIFKKDTPEHFCLSKNSFKIYENVIFHYFGNSEELFYDYVSDCLKNTILKFYEAKLLSNLIEYNYFYFSELEKKQILDLCIDALSEEDNHNIWERKNVVFYLCKEYVKENKAVILDGLVRFRLKEYMNILDSIVESCVNSYIIEKEYLEFINLLKFYIDSKTSSNTTLHLIYFNQESILLDNEKNVIKFDSDISNAKYLSDITFSSNDYCLNTLLNILPKKLYIHLLDEKEDEFISTLKTIFGKRVIICIDCKMCRYYKKQNIITKK